MIDGTGRSCAKYVSRIDTLACQSSPIFAGPVDVLVLADLQEQIELLCRRRVVVLYAGFSRSVFNAPPQAMTWPSMALTDFSCWTAGLKTLKCSKSVKSESPT